MLYNIYPVTISFQYTQSNRASYQMTKPARLGFFFCFVSWGGVRLSPLGTLATNWPTVPARDDRLWVWSSQWNENGQGNRITGRKHSPVPLCPPQIPHDLTWARSPAKAVGRRRLTAWAMAGPASYLQVISVSFKADSSTSRGILLNTF
jgi:hypothetical protein